MVPGGVVAELLCQPFIGPPEIRRVVAVRDTLTAAAANTASTTLIPQVADGVEAVLAEGLQHHLFLGRVLGKVKS